MRKVTLLIFLVVLAAHTFAQENPVAIKFDTYTDRKRNYESLVLMAEQFLTRLKNEPKTTKGAIVIYYKSTWDGDCLDGKLKNDTETEHFLRKVIDVDTELDQSRIIYVSGQMQMRDEIEFWLVPSGAKTPEATYRDYDPPCCCQALTVFGKPRVKRGTKTIKFFLWMGETKSPTKINYKWTVSNGKIIAGQGTSEIVVELGNANVGEVKATVEIDRPSVCNCPTIASETTKIVP